MEQRSFAPTSARCCYTSEPAGRRVTEQTCRRLTGLRPFGGNRFCLLPSWLRLVGPLERIWVFFFCVLNSQKHLLGCGRCSVVLQPTRCGSFRPVKSSETSSMFSVESSGNSGSAQLPVTRLNSGSAVKSELQVQTSQVSGNIDDYFFIHSVSFLQQSSQFPSTCTFSSVCV